MKVSYLGMTGYDGPAPGFEVWPAPSTYCDPAIAHASIERTLTLCEKADALGFDWVSVSEHHYAPYMMTPKERKSVVSGKRVSVRVDTGGRREIKKNTHKRNK